MKKHLALALATTALAFTTLSANAAPKQFNYCLKDNPTTFDPAQLPTIPTGIVIAQMYEPLLYTDNKAMEVKPMLAEKWEVSKDGLTYTLHIRKGVQFHSNKYFKPTRDLQADDVFYTFERQMNENYTYYRKNNYFWVGVFDLKNVIDSYKVVDKYTFQIKIKQPDATFLRVLGMYNLWIHSFEYEKQILDAKKDDVLLTNPVGTGAYQLIDFKSDSYVHLSKFNKYWGQVGNIDRVSFDIVKNEQVRISKLQSGECDFFEEPSVKAQDQLRAVKDVAFQKDPSTAMSWFNVNVQSNGLDDVNARRAVMYAIDYDRLIKEGLLGHATRSAGVVPDGMPGRANDAKPIKQDLAKAREFLSKSKYPNGFETVILVDSNLGDNDKTVAEMMQNDLAKINITAKVESLDHGAYIKKLYSDDKSWGLNYFVWHADVPDVSNFYNPFLLCGAVGGSSTTRFCDSNIDNKLHAAMAEQNETKRAKMYEEMHGFLVDQVPYISFASPNDYNVYRADRMDKVEIPFTVDLPRFQFFTMK